ncbi:DUF2993 domain-containing protein [Streptomyces sp. AC555_RSS877]|uniref:LmeA family phospholipid-binding protein n=1 Tax=Streptomyces sp. AC555_RSS877 TaxID=2823688 RepID=UPI0027E43109|nr:DUF2993 domain-containing protein [Streptomyces sp. AC555_RSS877]
MDHRPLRTNVIAAAALLTLAFLVASADRLTTAWVEARTAKAFQEGMDIPLPPEVHVRGFPVLTQLVDGTLSHVDITAHDIPAQGTGRPLPVTELALRLDDVRNPTTTVRHARARRRPLLTCRTRTCRTPSAWRSPKAHVPAR